MISRHPHTPQSPSTLDALPRMPRPFGRPSHNPFGALVVLVWCLSEALVGTFGGGLFWRNPVAEGALCTTITREGGVRLTTCASRH